MRLLPAALLFGALLAAPAAAPAADIVRLKDGRVLEGELDDRGEYIILKIKGPNGVTGAVRIERREVLSIQLDGEQKRTRDELDIVILLNGDELAGRVELRNEGRRVVVIGTGGEGRSGETVLDHRQVRTILWSHRAEAEQKAADGGGIGRTVERLIDELQADDLDARRRAQDQLLHLGTFALPYLESRPTDGDPGEVQEVLSYVLDAAHARSFMSGFLIERLPDLPRRVANRDPEVRQKALQQAVLTSPKDCPPLFAYLVRREQSGEVRAFLIAQLSLMGRVEELVDLLRERDPGLRLAAALALGDNGVFVGMESVIDALGHEQVEVRKVAIDALERWTGQFLGFFASDPEERRQAAVKRWRSWFEQNGDAFIDRSLRATVQRERISEDERTEGRAYWVNAQNLWERVVAERLEGEARRDELEKVRFYLLKALERYPHFLNARIALAELSYAELDDTAAARRELGLVLHRYKDDAGPETLRQAFYHMGRIAHQEQQWSEAARHLRRARNLDASDYRVARELGRLAYDRALNEGALEVEERRRLLAESIRAFDRAAELLELYSKEVDGSRTAADTVSDDDRPFERGRFLNQLDALKLQLTRDLAELHFLRGRAHAARGDVAEAYAAYVRASETQPESAMYLGAVQIWKRQAEAAGVELPDVEDPAEEEPPEAEGADAAAGQGQRGR